MSSLSHMDKTSAASNVVAFDYQHYHFLFRLLGLKENESVGLEVKDDVDITLDNNCQILIQVKHSIQNSNSGSTKNLTTYDTDLWKTIYNWSCVISDPVQNRTDILSQLEYVKKTDFILSSNKSESDKNKFINIVNQIKSQNITIGKAIGYITKLKNNTDNNDIKTNIDKLLSLDESVINEFLGHIYFDLGVNDIIKSCKSLIKTKMISDNKIDEVFERLDSQIKQDNYYEICDGKKIIITFEEFHKKYKIIFERARSPELQASYSKDKLLPDNLSKQTFIKQLIDIDYIKEDEVDDIIKFTRHKLNMEDNINRWRKNSELTKEELENFDDNVINDLDNRRRKHYRGLSEEKDIIEKAQELVDQSLQKDWSIRELQLSTMLSNGQYFRLSDIPVIGWHLDWEKKYK